MTEADTSSIPTLTDVLVPGKPVPARPPAPAAPPPPARAAIPAPPHAAAPAPPAPAAATPRPRPLAPHARRGNEP
ncbi:DUF2486 family protein, partial [Burkholderia contaminans]